jgi:hypothetical protein
MPRRSPKSTDEVATAVTTHTIAICVSTLTGKRSSSLWMPALMEFTPKPSDVQTPKVVHAMLSASTKSPTGPYTKLPITG